MGQKIPAVQCTDFLIVFNIDVWLNYGQKDRFFSLLIQSRPMSIFNEWQWGVTSCVWVDFSRLLWRWGDVDQELRGGRGGEYWYANAAPH